MSFTSCFSAWFNWHSCQHEGSLLWLPMTWRQRFLTQKYFISIPSLTWSLTLHLLFCSVRRSLYLEKRYTQTHTDRHTHTHAHTHKHTHVFNKLLKILLAFFRRIGTLTKIYLDNMLLIGRKIENVQMYCDTVILLFQKLGRVINLKNSVMILSQEMEFLGMAITPKKWPSLFHKRNYKKWNFDFSR